jgi:catechol-2,3-dioxygenase
VKLRIKGRQAPRTPWVHHATVEIPIDNMSACFEFYEGILGLHSMKGEHPQSVWYREGIHLYWGQNLRQKKVGEPPLHHTALVLGNRYEQVRKRCISLGLFVVEGKEYWGSKRAYVRDPAFNRIEIMEFAPK